MSDKIDTTILVKLLCSLAGKQGRVVSYMYESREKNTEYVIATQEEIAKACNVSRQTVSNTIQSLISEGVLEKKSGAYKFIC